MAKPKLPTMDELRKHLGDSPFVMSLLDEMNKAQTTELSGKVVFDTIMNQPVTDGVTIVLPKESK
jgi:hypothetical protein